MSMYLVPLAWLYVALMMAVAEASNSNGSVLGAVMTFVLYGLLPAGLLFYILGTPARKRRLRTMQEALAQEAHAQEAHAQEALAHQTLAQAYAASADAPPPPARATPDTAVSAPQPDAGAHTPADAVTPERKEP